MKYINKSWIVVMWAPQTENKFHRTLSPFAVLSTKFK